MRGDSLTKASENTPGRDHSIDNIRFLAIAAVVLAHLMESAADFRGRVLLYQIIYTFHMPVFIFLFGYYVKYSPKRIVFRWVVPYFVCQTLYILFARFVLGEAVTLQYTSPYWVLWYLLVCVFYQLLIPIYDVRQTRSQVIVLLASFLLALLAGYENSIGYYMSLSRFFVLQPWFLLGYYCRRHSVLDKPSSPDKRYVWISVLSTGLVCLSVLYLRRQQVPNQLLYGSVPYSAVGVGAWMRAGIMLITLSWLVFTFAALRPLLNRRLPIITAIGRNTLPVFLMHGFVVKLVLRFAPKSISSPWRILLLACAILILTGNRYCRKAIDWICLCWLEKYISWKET